MKNSRRILASSDKTIHIPAVFFAAATVFIICFIFSNSLQSRAVSSTHSGKVMQLFQLIFDPRQTIPEETLHRFIRKLAHFIEFAALGMSVCGLFLSLRSKLGRNNFGMMLFLVLAVAVTDEFIQSFTGRYSSVQDVILDFFGALFGIAALWLCSLLLFRILKKKDIKNT